MRFEITVKMASAGDPMFFLKTVVTHFECVGCKRCIFEQERGWCPKVEEQVPAETEGTARTYKKLQEWMVHSYLLGLLAKIKCSICSY